MPAYHPIIGPEVQKNGLANLHPTQPLYRILTLYSVGVETSATPTLFRTGRTRLDPTYQLTIRRHTTHYEKMARRTHIYGAIDDTYLGVLNWTE
jgi:hypothetical protein